MTPCSDPIVCRCGAEIDLDAPWPMHFFEAHPLGSVIRCWRCRARLRCVQQEADGEQDAEGVRDASAWRWVPIDQQGQQEQRT